ncbi:MAG: hypothetical protein LBF19_03695 [Prevotellaceae bacterium]|jgi:hypothetical protein|nr:hypothetical protein [Prevotellaceae bacterium]
MKLSAANSADHPADFNREWAQSVKETEFVKHFMPSLWQDLPETKRRAELAKAYRILNGKPVAEDKPVETPSEAPADKNEGAQ